MNLHRAFASSLLIVVGLVALWALASPANSALVAAPIDGGGGGGGQGGQGNFGLQSLHGRHGFTYSGSTQTLGPVASSGRIDFDGLGHVAAVYTTSVNGTAFTGTFTGTYTVQSDGTGSIVVDLPLLGLQSRGDFVIVDHGEGTFFTSTEPGYSVTGSTRRM
jgi:hypothetical protein